MVRKIEMPQLYEGDIEKIRNYLGRRFYSFQGARNQAIIALLLKSGMKTGVLTSLNISEYNKQQGVLIPHHPKAPQQIKLDEETRKIINHYLTLRWEKLFPIFFNSRKEVFPLFINNFKQEFHENIEDLRLSDRQVQRIIKDFAKRYKLSKNFSPKSFRHIAGLYYASLGLDNATINNILGNVAPWVKTDYRKLNQDRSVVTLSKPPDLRPKCKIHNVKMKEAEHKKFGVIWMCPERACLYMLSDTGEELMSN